MTGKWSWDYEDGAIPPYYHIDNDDGTLFVDDCRQSDEMDRVIDSLVQAHNALETDLAQLQHKLNTLRSKLLDVLGEAAVDGPFVVGDPAAGGIRPARKDPSP